MICLIGGDRVQSSNWVLTLVRKCRRCFQESSLEVVRKVCSGFYLFFLSGESSNEKSHWCPFIKHVLFTD